MTRGSRAADAAVIGAGSSGLAVLKALRDKGVPVACFERGSDVGGLWRYENDNGLSSAYASLRTNVSRPRMQYPGFPMPASYGAFPHHAQMWAYLRAYVDAHRLRESIQFRVAVERVAGTRWHLACLTRRRLDAPLPGHCCCDRPVLEPEDPPLSRQLCRGNEPLSRLPNTRSLCWAEGPRGGSRTVGG